MIALYSVAANEPLTRALIGFAMYVPGFALALTNLDGGPTVKAGNFLFGLVIGGGASVAGLVVPVSHAARDGPHRRGRQAQAPREELEAERLEAVAAERARIAGELHDVIAHSVSVMVVQAEAGEAVLLQSPERALEPLRAVQQTGRQAMVEMSRLLGLLRDHGDEIGLAPTRTP